MLIHEICEEIIHHQIDGLMFHEELTIFFSFLSLKGFKQCQEYHYLEEMQSYQKFYDHYINFYEKLLKLGKVAPANSIPVSWYENAKRDVDYELRQKSIKQGYDKWLEWEENTLSFYKDKYRDAFDIGEFAIAEMIKELILDVTQEIIEIKEQFFWLYSINFDMSEILDKQETIEKEYKKKKRKMFK